jgi:CRP-like cAMP-binding protein
MNSVVKNAPVCLILWKLMKHETPIDRYFSRLKDHIRKSIKIDDATFDQVKAFFSLRTVDRNQYLLRPMDVSKYESYVVKGLFQTSITDDSGRQHTLYFPHEDWWVGDFKSFKTGRESALEILALEDSVLLQISRESLGVLFEELPVFERFFRILNENAIIALQDRLVQHYSVDAKKKYLDFQVRYPSIQHRLLNKTVASYLGVTPEYFSALTNKK